MYRSRSADQRRDGLKKQSASILLNGACVLGLASSAGAAPVVEPLGSFECRGSWAEGWNLGGIAYDFVEIAMVTKTRMFVPPLMSGFSVSGWDLIRDFGSAQVFAQAPLMRVRSRLRGSRCEGGTLSYSAGLIRTDLNVAVPSHCLISSLSSPDEGDFLRR